MAKGADSKKLVEDALIAALKDNYIGTFDKKIYFEFKEAGERVQIAVSMTCPKTLVCASPVQSFGEAGFPAPNPAVSSAEPPSAFSEKDSAEIDRLMRVLGL